MGLSLTPETMQFDWPAPVMTVAEVAAVVRVTPKTVRQHIRRGLLRAIQFDGAGPYRVRAEDAQRWADLQLVEPDAGALAVDRYVRRAQEQRGIGARRSARAVTRYLDGSLRGGAGRASCGPGHMFDFLGELPKVGLTESRGDAACVATGVRRFVSWRASMFKPSSRPRSRSRFAPLHLVCLTAALVLMIAGTAFAAPGEFAGVNLSQEVLEQDTAPNGTATNSYYNGAQTGWAQTFTAGATAPLTSLELMAARMAGGSNDPLTVSIREITSTGQIGTTVLATQTRPRSDFPEAGPWPQAPALTRFRFESPPMLTAGVQYAVVITGADYYLYTGSPDYTRGSKCYRNQGATTCGGNYASPDFILRTYRPWSDVDGDEREDGSDNCPQVANADQEDQDGDRRGDACDSDRDGDGTPNDEDAFPDDAGESQDSDGDGIGDNADAFPTDPDEAKDTDGDGVGDNADAFPNDETESQDTDGDGVGDNADEDNSDGPRGDLDRDGTTNEDDNCPNIINDGQEDLDDDGRGDACDPDVDGDGTPNDQDAFPRDPSESNDTDGDGIGDNADTERDGDGVNNDQDAFPDDKNESVDTDGDGIGNNADTDDDGDGTPDEQDDFPLDASRQNRPAQAAGQPAGSSVAQGQDSQQAPRSSSPWQFGLRDRVTMHKRGRKVRLNTGYTVGCPVGGATCTGRVTLKVRVRTAGRMRSVFLAGKVKTKTIRPGAEKELVFTMNRHGRRLLRRNESFTAILRGSIRVGGEAPVVRSSRLTIAIV